jgi:CSLREA domain-containing protein
LSTSRRSVMRRIPTNLFAVTLLVAAGSVDASRALAPIDLQVDTTVDEARGECSRRGCTLRDAIAVANTHDGPATISFDLPNPPWTIRLQRPLPSLGDDVVLDGARAGVTCPTPGLHLDGSAIGVSEAHGLVLAGDNAHVHGVAVTGFGGHGILILGRGNRVTCSHAGVLPDGYTAAPNRGDGIRVWGAAETRLGGREPEDALLLGANLGWGLRVVDAFLTRWDRVAIGVDREGRPTLLNGVRLRPDDQQQLPGFESTTVPQPVADNLRAVMERQLAEALEAPAQALAGGKLARRYGRLLARRGVDRPRTLNELVLALADAPDLQTAFLADLEALVAEAEADALTKLLPWLDRFERAVPNFGRDVPNAGAFRRDVVSEQVSALPAGTYTLSSFPMDILAAILTDPPVGLAPLNFAGLHTYGPTGITTPVSNIPLLHVCESGGSSCQWPVAHDLLPYSFALFYDSVSLSKAELDAIVAQQDRRFVLRLNGVPQVHGPAPNTQPNNVPVSDYWAVSLPASACPHGVPCIALNVLARGFLEDTPLPWTFEFDVDQLVPIEPTPVLDKFGNLVFVTQGWKSLWTVTTTVTPNPTNATTWFDAALAATFESERCQSCHALKTVQALFQHHVQYIDWWTDLASFQSSQAVALEPSAYVPGGHVITCLHCHHSTIPFADGDGDPFHETAWKTPAADLDIDWSQKTPAQVCQRVIANLPTQALRHEHFHEDARLFWAIQAPESPPPVGSLVLEAALPKSWDIFLNRVDVWNAFGAPCP